MDNVTHDISSDTLRKLDAIGRAPGLDPRAAIDSYVKDRCDGDDEQLWRRLNEDAGSSFAEVFQYELDALDGSPGAALGPAELGEVQARAHRARLSGLALSGGGIRSATFNLGVIQALAEKQMLRHFDYLSTVSGGGYIGGWLSKYIHENGGEVEKVEEALAPPAGRAAATEPAAVQFLRQYSNYLSPRTGLFSADTWALLSTYLRNTMLNMTMLAAWLCALFLLPRLIVLLVGSMTTTRADVIGFVSCISFLIAVGFIAFSISRRGAPTGAGMLRQTQGRILWCVCLPLLIAGFVGSVALSQQEYALVRFWNTLPQSLLSYPALPLLEPGLAYFMVWGAGWIIAQRYNGRDLRRSAVHAAGVAADGVAAAAPAPATQGGFTHTSIEGAGHLLCAMGALALSTIGLLKVVATAHAARAPLSQANPIELATLGMPLMLALFGVTMTLMIGLIGRMYSDQSREWWARMGAWTGILCFVWLLLFGCVFYLPPLVQWAFREHAVSASLGTVLSSAITYFGLRSGSGPNTGKVPAAVRLELVALVAPYAFSLLLIAALAYMLQAMVAGVPGVAPGSSLRFYCTQFTALSASPDAVVKPFWLFLLAALVLGCRVDINKFSLYMMYRMRLVRAYCGATSKVRSPHPFTGFDPADDPDLASLLKQAGPTGDGGPLQRPYHIINAALNLVNGKELAWQSRKAANFVFTPGYSGFETPSMAGADRRTVGPLRGAFRPTSQYASQTMLDDDPDAVVKLGAAMAISGAAASPNMGYHSSAPLSFLMTMFNLRLGRWSPNPMKPKVWRKTSPPIGLFSILSELFGLTDMEADFLYLSDGGHFENLGLYELVRRRCRLIVVVDAGADQSSHFEDLGNAIRKCLTDMNIAIHLDARGIRTFSNATGAGASYVTGRVHYAEAEGCHDDGVLLYIKPTICGDENADVHNYSTTHPEFPHQSTIDQFFDEDQFESYRSLGYQIARKAFSLMPPPPPPPPSTVSDRDPAAGRRERTEQICAQLKRGGVGQLPISPVPVSTI